MKRILNRYRAKKDLDETPEFFNPQHGLEIDEYIKREDMLAIHHLGRYHWAKQVLEAFAPDRVLDIACGTGYGSSILASHLSQAEVVGAGYDLRAIETARQAHRRDNLSYVLGNMVTWEYEHGESSALLGSFDAILSFDTIEHLQHREIALIRVTQNLSAVGAFLFSTPCGHSIPD